MIERLDQINNRYNEIQEKLSSNEVIQDIKRTTELSKELRNLEETVNTYKEYKNVLSGISSAYFNAANETQQIIDSVKKCGYIVTD